MRCVQDLCSSVCRLAVVLRVAVGIVYVFVEAPGATFVLDFRPPAAFGEALAEQGGAAKARPRTVL